MSDLIGRTLANRYHVNAFLGKGGMAEAYKVWDRSRMATLAIKVLNPGLAGDVAFLDHFRAEASALARLQHPDIVRFYSLERDGDIAFIVMDYVEGNTLREEIKAHRIISPQRILQIMRDVCAALNYAHEMGYVHCDIKPANIMINRNGSALVSDFGIARLAGNASDAIVRGGTAGYMSPEQIRGETPTRASDIYALGVLLFEMLTGARPFTGQTTQTMGSTAERIRWQQAHLSPPSPRQYNPSVSAELEGIVLRCLEKDAARRYPNVQSLLSALEQPLPRDASRARVEYVPGPAAQVGGPARSVITSLNQSRRSKIVWAWFLIVIPVIILLVVMIGGGGGRAIPIATVTAARYRTPTLVRSQVPTLLPLTDPVLLSPIATLISPPDYTPSPSFSIRAYDPSTDQNADCIICQFADWEEPRVPGSYHWDVSYPSNTPVRLLLGWCALDQQTLDANWPGISFELIIDDIPIDLDELTFETFATPSNNPCYGYSGALTDWSSGRHQYTQILHFSQTLNDGWNTYEAGEYIENFTVDVQ